MTAASLVLAGGLSSCAYVRHAAVQTGYSLRQRGAPEVRVFKHMVDRPTFYVFGTLTLRGRFNPDALAVVAVSDRFTAGEIVDVNHFSRQDSYYGLNLPDGRYQLLLVTDGDRNGFYEASEIIGARELVLNSAATPERVRGGFNLEANDARPATGAFRVPVQNAPARVESLWYPKGSIRQLDDPIFAPSMAHLGLYDPAAFLERAPMMFYALEEDAGQKVPVVFVHGIDGSARDFAALVARLDRTRYKPWFFHYASGSDLSQLSEMFYWIFLSGKVIPMGETPMVIVAHSMGGLVVRDALNRCTGAAGENRPTRLITIASPLGGHPAARNGARVPYAIASWRDLDPDSRFIARLHRRPLPAGLAYHLFYTFGNDHTVKLGANGDGTVPLSSQLAEPAQKEATAQFGFNDTHVGVLADPGLITHVLQVVGEVKSPVPEDHLRLIAQRGYGYALGPQYTRLQRYALNELARYMDALVAGQVQPFEASQVHFVAAGRGRAAPTTEVEEGWLRFNREFPDRPMPAPVAP
jgi:pimeloyl-ACP methyl ester carboxylesterase